MRAVVTRVSSASVSIGGTVEGAIEQGFLVLLGVGPGDTEAVCDKLAEKICNLRVFEDENGRMNLSLEQVGGALLVVSQFTLYADTSSRRPGFTGAARPDLAVPLYEKWDLLRKNVLAIVMGILAGTLASLGSVLVLSLLLRLDHSQYITLLPKSVTTAISMDVSKELGGIAALTGAIVILTGILGALMAETVCKVCHITHPIARGIGIGTAAHAVGTSKALQMGEVEGAMSGLAVAVAGVMTAILCPVFSSFIS